MDERIRAVVAHTAAQAPEAAAQELARSLAPGERGALSLVFASPGMDLARLGRALEGVLPWPVTGCSTSGQLGPGGYVQGGVTMVTLVSNVLDATVYVVEDLGDVAREVRRIAAQAGEHRLVHPDWHSFGLLLVDGLTRQEEFVAAALYGSLGAIPFIGGSAGDDLRFQSTAVYARGRFLQNAATFTLCITPVPFTTFKFQHFVASERLLVITAADPAARTVTEINGYPAAEEYARQVGVHPEELTPDVFSRNPIILTIHDEPYVRSIQRANPDGSLTFFCAIEEGLVVSLGVGVDPMQTVEDALAAAERTVGGASVILGCDCILRRLEFQHDATATRVGKILSRHRVVGFSTYGEQFNGLHINQTFTGVALGR